ncbi:MAG TPA: M55 family metallopeptidase, partial [Thermoplasmata archaeon]
KPFVVKRPVQMEVQLERPLMAEHVSNIPLVKRVDMRTVSYKAKDVLDAFRVFQLINWVASYAKDEGPL